MSQVYKLVSNEFKKSVSSTDFYVNERIQKVGKPLELKAKLSLIGFALVSIWVLVTAYLNESIFIDKIAISLFIITCLGVIRFMSGNITRESK
ncbi:hypothetical protein [Winogradskyella aurantiaca]|uniref:hypothetical protein n=1 Tax=Winogradskyella aurantiaca TaxID=2219558 RepID=UPI000E1CC0EE|nr:hypothetical protein [Winogradskyella aurantiaca]